MPVNVDEGRVVATVVAEIVTTTGFVLSMTLCMGNMNKNYSSCVGGDGK